MAFELTDFFRSYVPRGEYRGLFNPARADEASASSRYYLYFNEAGSYVIQKVAVAANVSIYSYFASKDHETALANWTGRAGLTYVEYWELFHQGDV